MSKHRFSYTQRYALWRAYEMKCFYCERPLDLKSVTIDHVVPKYLEDSPDERQRVLEDYEIEQSFSNFSINDYCNWVPSDGPSCNFRKGKTLLPKKVSLFFLSEAQKKLPKVASELARLKHGRKQSKILGELGSAIELKVITEEHIHELLGDLQFEQTKDQPLIITFGLLTSDVPYGREIPDDISSLPFPIFYVHLCDWLEDELVTNLKSLSPFSFHYAEESHRDGDSLSVRVVFPELSLDKMDSLNLPKIQKAMPWWDILEITNFYQIYDETYEEAFPK